jgi:hypothetical protein
MKNNRFSETDYQQVFMEENIVVKHFGVGRCDDCPFLPRTAQPLKNPRPATGILILFIMS